MLHKTKIKAVGKNTKPVQKKCALSKKDVQQSEFFDKKNLIARRGDLKNDVS
jgi:hypothetical protein